MSTEEILPLTFGVEFEFFFGIRRSSVYNANNRTTFPRGAFKSWFAPVLAKILADRGLEVLVSGIDDTLEYEQWILDYEIPQIHDLQPTQTSTGITIDWNSSLASCRYRSSLDEVRVTILPSLRSNSMLMRSRTAMLVSGFAAPQKRVAFM